MKASLLALLVAVLALVGCATQPTVSSARLTSVELRYTRTFETTLHVDSTLRERAADLVAAADAVGKLTDGAAKIAVVFDLDFASVQTLAELRDQPRVLGVHADDPMVRSIDAKGAPANAFTVASSLGTPPAHVYLVLDRIAPGDLRGVFMHELGHVIGLPDLETHGDVMSRERLRGTPAPTKFTEADVGLYRSHHFVF